MAYKMEYGKESTFVYPTVKENKRKKNKSKKWIMIGLIAALIIVCSMTDILIPGDAAVTKAAMSDLISNVKGGEQVVDAFAAFCQTVLQGS